MYEIPLTPLDMLSVENEIPVHPLLTLYDHFIHLKSSKVFFIVFSSLFVIVLNVEYWGTDAPSLWHKK